MAIIPLSSTPNHTIIQGTYTLIHNKAIISEPYTYPHSGHHPKYQHLGTIPVTHTLTNTFEIIPTTPTFPHSYPHGVIIPVNHHLNKLWQSSQFPHTSTIQWQSFQFPHWGGNPSYPLSHPHWEWAVNPVSHTPAHTWSIIRAPHSHSSRPGHSCNQWTLPTPWATRVTHTLCIPSWQDTIQCTPTTARDQCG